MKKFKQVLQPLNITAKSILIAAIYKIKNNPYSMSIVARLELFKHKKKIKKRAFSSSNRGKSPHLLKEDDAKF